LKANPPATAAEASFKIEQEFGIKRSSTQIRNFMLKIGMKCRKVGHIPAKANPEEQKRFHDEELQPRLNEAKKQKDQVVLFVDAVHVVWQVFLGMLWCFERIFIPAAAGRRRINILGAYDPISNILHKIVNDTYITSVTVCDLLVLLKDQYKEKAITLVLDNASYQRCKLVMKKAADLGIELLFLPTYSPNLNLIERMWRFLKNGS
jgi:transposase